MQLFPQRTRPAEIAVDVEPTRANHRQQQVRARREVGIDGAPGHAGASRDLLQAGRGETLFLHDSPGRGDQRRPRPLAFVAPPGLFR